MSPIQEKILQHFRQYQAQHGHAPTLAELGELVNIRSRGTMHRHVTALVEQGQLEKSPLHWRGLRLVETDMDTGMDETLPLAGRIAAGQPIEAIEGRDEISPSALLCGRDRFTLEVQGDSMTGIGIMDGDFVVIQRQEHAEDGQVVVALIDNDEATLKRLHRSRDGMIELIAENSEYGVMRYAPDRVRIQGVLVGQMRVYR